ncbi:hypothetical protein [Nocardioides astragali]|uniref:Uncharacterized protein n=1 Tax=Nocardioides astragali TaxID=1776736 RepID=A0ABW2MYE2_9ACTN|nr:hypothetical protein [Nocardioides astragali]
MATAAAASAGRQHDPAPARTVDRWRRRARGAVVEAVQPPQRGGRDDGGDQRRDEVQRTGARAQHGEHFGDAGEPDDDEQADGLAPSADDARDGRQHQDDRHDRAHEDGFVRGAELPDRPLLERRGRQVDDGGAHRQHRRRGRHGECGDEVGGRETDDGGQHTVPRMAERAPPGVLVGGLHVGCSEWEWPRMARARTTTGKWCGIMRT